MLFPACHTAVILQQTCSCGRIHTCSTCRGLQTACLATQAKLPHVSACLILLLAPPLHTSKPAGQPQRGKPPAPLAAACPVQRGAVASAPTAAPPRTTNAGRAGSQARTVCPGPVAPRAAALSCGMAPGAHARAGTHQRQQQHGEGMSEAFSVWGFRDPQGSELVQ